MINPKVIDTSHYTRIAAGGFVRCRAAGYVGIIQKASEGAGLIDDRYADRVKPILDAGLLTGAYHFLRPGSMSQQAEFFLRCAKPTDRMEISCDYEVDNVSPEMAREFIESVEAKLGRQVVLYSGNTIKEKLGSEIDPWWAKHRLWTAQYSTRWTVQRSWTKPWLWQFTGDNLGPPPHYVDGIGYGVDISSYDGTDEQLRMEWASGAIAVPVPVVPPPAAAPSPLRDKILALAAASELASHDWPGRGRAPIGYVKGMALCYARVYRNLKGNDPTATFMARANTGNDAHDALSWYGSRFSALGWSNDADGPDTLRHLFALLIGLGMRESSGSFCEGRDVSAPNTTSNTAEAGLFQQSWGTSIASSLLPQLLQDYHTDLDGFADVFHEGVRCTMAQLQNYGSGAGLEFQRLCKAKPAFAVEAALVGLRVVRQEWGPINRHDVELSPKADLLLIEIQKLIDDSAPADA